MSGDAVVTVEAFFAALEAGDVRAVGALYHDDLVVWHSHTGQVQTRAENLATLQAMLAVGQPVYCVHERVVQDGRVAQRHTLALTLANGHVAELDAAIFLTVRDGRILRIDEYLDSAADERLLQSLRAAR